MLALYTTESKEGVKCPSCRSDALNKYGKAWTGKQRYICLVCDTQFTISKRMRIHNKNRPLCPECGKMMYLYKRETGMVRFRCAGYPECRSYHKVILKEEQNS